MSSGTITWVAHAPPGSASNPSGIGRLRPHFLFPKAIKKRDEAVPAPGLDKLKKTKPKKNWRPTRAGGCRTIIRVDHRV